MLSMPPATTTVESPAWTDWAPRHTDFSPEPHTIWQLHAGTGYGIPAATLAWRAGFCPWPEVNDWKELGSKETRSKVTLLNTNDNMTCGCGTFYLPAVRTCPMITSETSSGFTPARVRTSLITTEHRTCTGTEDREPLRDPVWGGNMEYYLKNMLFLSQLVIIYMYNCWLYWKKWSKQLYLYLILLLCFISVLVPASLIPVKQVEWDLSLYIYLPSLRNNCLRLPTVHIRS